MPFNIWQHINTGATIFWYPWGTIIAGLLRLSTNIVGLACRRSALGLQPKGWFEDVWWGWAGARSVAAAGTRNVTRRVSIKGKQIKRLRGWNAVFLVERISFDILSNYPLRIPPKCRLQRQRLGWCFKVFYSPDTPFKIWLNTMTNSKIYSWCIAPLQAPPAMGQCLATQSGASFYFERDV